MVHEPTSAHGSWQAAVRSIAEKIDCHPETLLVDATPEGRTGHRAGVSRAEQTRALAVKRTNRKARYANKMLNKTAALFAVA
jgi:transposase-like protein